MYRNVRGVAGRRAIKCRDGTKFTGDALPMTIAAQSIDRTGTGRWFYVSMALLLMVVAIVGFSPNSAGILFGRLPNPPLLVHVHAALMFGWLLLLLTQSALIATNRRPLHRRLGKLSLVLVPAILIVMTLLVSGTIDGPRANGIAVVQGRRLILFSVFFLLALRYLKRDIEGHRRMQFWATVVLLDAALLRMPWLPDFGITNIAVKHAYQLALMLPMLAFDWSRLGRIHPANRIGLLLMLLTGAVAAAVW